MAESNDERTIDSPPGQRNKCFKTCGNTSKTFTTSRYSPHTTSQSPHYERPIHASSNSSSDSSTLPSLYGKYKAERQPLLHRDANKQYESVITTPPPIAIKNEHPIDLYSAYTQNVTLLHQFRAVFLKDLSLQLRQWGTNLCQLLVPVILICFIGIIQVIATNILEKNHAAIPGSDLIPVPVQLNFTIPCLRNDSDGGRPFNCTNDFRIFAPLLDNIKNCLALKEFVKNLGPFITNLYYLDCDNPRRFFKTLPQNILFELPYYFLTAEQNINNEELGYLSANGNRHGLLGATVDEQYWFSLNFTINPHFTDPFFSDHTKYNNNTRDNLYAPFFYPLNATNSDSILDKIYHTMLYYNELTNSSVYTKESYYKMYQSSPQSNIQYYTILSHVKRKQYSEIRPYGGIHVRAITNNSIDLTLVAPKFQISKIHYENQHSAELINRLSNAWYRFKTSTYQATPIKTWIFAIPEKPAHIDLDLTSLVGGFLLPFATSFIIPVFICNLVKDKHEKHLIMMQQSGLSLWAYWLITFLFDYMLYIGIIFVIAIVCLMFQMRLFTQTSPLILFPIFSIWGFTEVVMGFFYSCFFARPKTAVVIGYLIVIAGVIISNVIDFQGIFPDNQNPGPYYMLYPPFAFYRLMFYMNTRCQEYQCFQAAELFTWSTLTAAIVYLLGGTILFLLVSLYLTFILPSEFGIKKHPLFCILPVYRMCKRIIKSVCRCCYIRNYVQRDNIDLGKHSDDGPRVDEENVDEEVQAEDYFLSEGPPQGMPISMYRLRKVFRRGGVKHIAVRGISLGIPAGQCFGLLGMNGAGKTTLISTLTGLYSPTSGKAVVAGYDLKNEMSKIYRHLGVCPQFDIQYEDLTAREHLLFYARLKGLKRSFEKSVVDYTLNQVNLLKSGNVRSKNLSGGMRRRLSVAIATINNPDILILDEPTTGLDPGARYQVWEVIERIKHGRSVILTTHAMEEADRLCTRIGIMHYGILRVLGTQNRLKSMYGSGYELTIHTTPDNIHRVMSYIQLHIPHALLIECYAGTIKYRIKKDLFNISEMFEVLDKSKFQVGVTDWGLKRTTLEDVFLNVVQREKDWRLEENHAAYIGRSLSLRFPRPE